MGKQPLGIDTMNQRMQTSAATTRTDSPETDAVADLGVATLTLAGLLAVVFLPMVALGVTVGASAYALTPRLRDRGIALVELSPTRTAPNTHGTA
jgi:uncharacterized membrane protein